MSSGECRLEMKNEEDWQPTKIDWHPDGRWRIRVGGVSPGSLLTAIVQQEALIPLIRRYLRGRIADIGAGDVPFYPGYRDQVESITCIDWGQSMHDSCKHSDLLCDLNKGLPLSDTSIDAALMSSVLEHIAEPWNILSELYRCLTPGGCVVIEVPFFYWLHEVPHDYYRYTRYALVRMAENAGFEIEKIAPYGNAFVVMSDIAAKTAVFLCISVSRRLHWRAQRVWLWLSFGAIRGFQRVALITLARGPLARMLNDSKFQHSFPLGYVAVLRRSTN